MLYKKQTINYNDMKKKLQNEKMIKFNMHCFDIFFNIIKIMDHFFRIETMQCLNPGLHAKCENKLNHIYYKNIQYYFTTMLFNSWLG